MRDKPCEVIWWTTVQFDGTLLFGAFFSSCSGLVQLHALPLDFKRLRLDGGPPARIRRWPQSFVSSQATIYPRLVFQALLFNFQGACAHLLNFRFLIFCDICRTSNSRNLFSVYLDNGGSEQIKADRKEECQAMEIHQNGKPEPLFTAEFLPDGGDQNGPAVILYKTPPMFDPDTRISIEASRCVDFSETAVCRAINSASVSNLLNLAWILLPECLKGAVIILCSKPGTGITFFTSSPHHLLHPRKSSQSTIILMRYMDHATYFWQQPHKEKCTDGVDDSLSDSPWLVCLCIRSASVHFVCAEKQPLALRRPFLCELLAMSLFSVRKHLCSLKTSIYGYKVYKQTQESMYSNVLWCLRPCLHVSWCLHARDCDETP